MAQQPCSVPARATDRSRALAVSATQRPLALAPARRVPLLPPPEREAPRAAPLEFADVIDRSLSYGVSRLTLGLSPWRSPSVLVLTKWKLAPPPVPSTFRISAGGPTTSAWR